MKKQKLFVNHLKQVAEKLNIDWIETKEKTDDLDKIKKIEKD